MAILFGKKYSAIIGIGALILLAVYLLFNTLKTSDSDLVTATAEIGEVKELVSVSGFVEAKNTADLAFPATGRVTDVFVDEGSIVQKGEVLATLGSSQLAASRNEALAALRSAEAAYQEVVTGPTATERAVTSATVKQAENNLSQTADEQVEKVSNARQTLLSNDLTAFTDDPQERSAAPTISGTYTCDKEGVYKISVYGSSAISGYSYQITGLENDSSSVFYDQASAFGNCGLFIQFSETNTGAAEWTIEIPNTRSSTYTTYKNAYDLALKQQQTALNAAMDNLSVVEQQAVEANSTARSEVVTQKLAAINQAQARIAQIDAELSDRSIIAPFAGIVTDVSILSGETASLEPVITMLANDAFELTARIPEIDIRKITLDQTAAVVFDANQKETLSGKITYISPLAAQIDGVAYFETTIEITDKPDWLRSGLNADVDIEVTMRDDVLKLPKRFIYEINGSTFVKVVDGKEIIETPINILFTGNDGYAAIEGIEPQTLVTTP